jgi:uncharacterized radical SAM protein YgiQ
MFLPVNKQDLKSRSITSLDIILISGEAYIDHPSFGIAIIARYLEKYGYKVGIISQPNINSDADFLALGKPNLFFGISSGNMDSMVNHYTAQKKLRSSDAYSPDGITGLRPNRAVIKYTQKIKTIFKNIPVVLGGIEASLRRIPHYDFWSDKLRNSILFDSKADILVYGMGEKAILSIADLLSEGKSIKGITDVPGTVVPIKIPDKEGLILPEYTKQISKGTFHEFNVLFDKNFQNKTIYQKCLGRYLRHNPPQKSLTTKEMDDIYSLPFERKPHPKYGKKKIPAYEQIRLSITSHRGCFGGCSFCTIGYHQGKTIQSRSIKSTYQELELITREKYFHGTITDVGGPSANMYGLFCKLGISDTCTRQSCLSPTICPHLETSSTKNKNLLKKLSSHPKLKHLFVSSGIRFDLALSDNNYIRTISKNHISGLLKLAPEHSVAKVLQLMNKPDFSLYEEFEKRYFKFSKEYNKKQFIVPYIIVGHPGETLEDTLELAIKLKQRNIKLTQIQEFTPTPMTLSTCMYYSGLNFFTGEKIHVAKGREIHLMKALIQWYKPENKKYIMEALKSIHKIGMAKKILPEKKDYKSKKNK